MELYDISPAGAKPIWILGTVCLLLLLIGLALGYTAYSARNSRVVLNAQALKIEGDFWARSIALQQIDISRCKVIRLAEQPDYRPVRRTLGTGLPGYASGWFRLANGDKALVYLTATTRPVYLPTRDGYVLLLSLSRPDQFILSLKRYANQRGLGDGKSSATGEL